MKFRIAGSFRWLAALACSLAFAAAAQQLTWKQVTGAANDIGVGANGHVWIIGTNSVPGGYGIWRWNGTAFQGVAGAAVRVGVDPQGNAWVVNDAGDIYKWNGNGWTQVAGKATDIAVGANGQVWIIDKTAQGANFGIARYTGTGWATVAGGATRIAVDNNGNPWVVNAATDIYRWNGRNFDRMPGQARDVAIGAANRTYVVGMDGAPWQWDGANFQKRDGNTVGTVGVDNSGNLWVINSAQHTIWVSSFGAAVAVTNQKEFLTVGEYLGVGNFLVSPNKRFFAIEQSDGNLCVYPGAGPQDNPTQAIWCHMKYGNATPFVYTVVQTDGNLCSFTGYPADVKGLRWCSMGYGPAGAYHAVLQNDANFCTYKGSSPATRSSTTPLWCSGQTRQVVAPVVPVNALAVRYAPQLHFTGNDEMGYPMSAQVYYDAMKGKTGGWSLENTDRGTLTRGEAPIYYQLRPVGAQMRIHYWIFYGLQHPCFGSSSGKHNGDWEHVIVTLSEDYSKIAAMTYYQHDGWYTRIAGPRDAPCTPTGIGRCEGSGGFKLLNNKPIVYVGQIAHGSFHDSSSGAGVEGLSCTYYGDKRSGNIIYDASRKLIDLDSMSEPWMAIDKATTSETSWTWGPDGISTRPTKTVADPNFKMCIGSPSWNMGSTASLDNNGPGCFKSECLSGDDQASERCLKECEPGYSNVGLTCNKGKWPWEWRIYCRLDSGKWYGYAATLPRSDAGLTRRRGADNEWSLP